MQSGIEIEQRSSFLPLSPTRLLREFGVVLVMLPVMFVYYNHTSTNLVSLSSLLFVGLDKNGLKAFRKREKKLASRQAHGSWNLMILEILSNPCHSVILHRILSYSLQTQFCFWPVVAIWRGGGVLCIVYVSGIRIFHFIFQIAFLF